VTERIVLPLIDEHERRIDADREQVWVALGRMLSGADSSDGALSTITFRLLGVRPGRTAGDPLHEGSTLQGFAVSRVVRPEILRLEGRHRFSRYALTFRLRRDGDSTIVTAESRGEFPGITGRAYRALVVGSGGHVIAVRRMLARISAETAR
jgi:hypothetical protein